MFLQHKYFLYFLLLVCCKLVLSILKYVKAINTMICNSAVEKEEEEKKREERERGGKEGGRERERDLGV